MDVKGHCPDQMNLDIIIPTYRRQDLLSRALASILGALGEYADRVVVTVVDNNSNDGTRELVEKYIPAFRPGGLRYIFEGRQGKSWAVNTAVAATQGELVAFIDDDEELDRHWIETAFRAFDEPPVDFIGGTTLPKFAIEPPNWLPPDYPAVIGKVESESGIVRQFGRDFNGVLMGGNAVIRREFLAAVAPQPYPVNLGRDGKRLLTADDALFSKLLDGGGRGLHIPSLIVYHNVRPDMLTKRYHRRWCFWNFVSLGIQDRAKRQFVAYLLGVPRWYYRAGVRGLVKRVSGLFLPGAHPGICFSGELDFIRLIGFFYGKHLFRR